MIDCAFTGRRERRRTPTSSPGRAIVAAQAARVPSPPVETDDPFLAAASGTAGARGGRRDPQAWVEVVAVRLTEALPETTEVTHSGGGLLGRGERRVRRVRVEVGASKFEAVLDEGRVVATRYREVGGVVIAREQLTPRKWITELTADLRTEAARSPEARSALQQLLG
jgi:hypothetical protein